MTGRARLSRSRALLVVASLALASSFFIGPYPPMTDVPQHAAQVRALGDLLAGESAFSDELEVNLLTPYWIGYGPSLLLSRFLPVHVAFGVLLSVGFLAFVGLFSKLREEVGASPLADWVALPSFFGFAYAWGMLTFLLAAPIGFVFLVAVERYRRSGGRREGAILVLVGVALYLSHVLAFAHFVVTGALTIALGEGLSPRRWAARAWPHVIFAALALVYLLRDDPLAGTFTYGSGQVEYGDGPGTRAWQLLHFPWSASTEDLHLALAALFLGSAPFIVGLRPSRSPARYAPLVASLLVWFALPHYWMSTYLLYQRFALFVFPAYALVFDASGPAETASAARVRALGAAVFFAMIAILSARPLADRVFFANESASFARLVERLPEERRALSLVFRRESEVISNPNVYLHFPQWYAAQRGGFVDFSFAWFHPQMVRFRRDHLPEVAPSFEWLPANFMKLRRCDRYDLIFVRAPGELPPGLLAGSTCPHVQTDRDGDWHVFRRPEEAR